MLTITCKMCFLKVKRVFRAASTYLMSDFQKNFSLFTELVVGSHEERCSLRRWWRAVIKKYIRRYHPHILPNVWRVSGGRRWQKQGKVSVLEDSFVELGMWRIELPRRLPTLFMKKVYLCRIWTFYITDRQVTLIQKLSRKRKRRF